MAAMPFLMAIAYMAYYYNKRYRSPLASAPLAPAEHFLVKYFGLVPPPSDTEKVDTLSRFLIRVGQDASLSPISVCWSITGTPLVIVNTLKGIKDVLIDGQAKSKVKDEPSKVQRGNLIRLIQNLVFGGKSLNNVVGEVRRHSFYRVLDLFQLTDYRLGMALAPTYSSASISTKATRAQIAAVCCQSSIRTTQGI